MSFLTPQQALNHAMDLQVAGRLDEAEPIYRRLLEIDPGSADVVHLLGILLFSRGQLDASIELMQRSIAMSPNVPRYHNNLGNALNDLGRFDEAIEALERAVALDPSLAPAYYNIGNAHSRARRWKAAIAAYQKSLAIRPGVSNAILNLGTAYTGDGQLDAAIALYREALATEPNAAIATNLGNVYRDKSDLDSSIEAYRAALRIKPSDAATLSNLGNALKDQGQIAESLAEFRKAIELDPKFSEAHSNLVFTMFFDAEGTPADLAAEHEAWDRAYGRHLRVTQPFPHDRSPDRKLRIGYLSPDLRDHVVGRTLLPTFEAHDHEQIEITCYSSAAPDHITARYRAHAEHWRDMNHLSDEKVDAMIRADRIDILVDLALHTAYNRLLVFARKPAPIQVSWLGYPGSSGLSAIDYHLSDPFLESTPSPDAYRLPRCWCTYATHPDSPAVNALPAHTRGTVTFGSFNNFCKMNTRVWELWGRILERVPNSRLVLLTKAGSHEEETRTIFRTRGIAPQRIEFLRYIPPAEDRPQPEFLRRYHEIDIALDPFPYNGMTTTCDSLWMGVPVVAMVGSTPVARASYSLLSNLGVPELAAGTGEDYVRIAVELATDLERLAALRGSLRQRMESSPLLDARSLARDVEAAYREMWRRWCAT